MSSVAHIYSEYEEMLKSFRCQDLANLLAFAGQSKNGKKSELLDRCLLILKKGNASHQLKIREIYNNKVATTSLSSYSSLISAVNSNSNSGSSSPDPNMLNGGRYQATSSAMPSSSLLNSGFTGSNSSSYQAYPGILNMPIQTGFNSMQPPASMTTRSSSTHYPGSSNTIRVQFERLAFYDHLHELLAPTKMIPLNSNSRPFSFCFNFFMTTDQANEITGTREFVSGKLEYSKQIHLRFGFFESTTQVDNLPANLVVNVNNKPAALPAPKPTSKPNADIIRPGRSIDVTSICRLAPNMPNKVDLNWINSDQSKTFCVGVYVFNKVSVAHLVAHLKTNCTNKAEATRQMVREKLQITDSDFEIETSTLKVSLLCPLMKFRINLPGRASTCKHVQCFDLESYLMMNEKKPTWNCPVCDQNAPFDNLLIDSLNQEILAACPRDIEEVVFAQDGSWTKVVPVDTKKSATQSDERSKAKSNEEEVCVEICDESPKKEPVKPSLASAAPIVAAKKNEEFIDLTMDSSDDESSFQKQQPEKRTADEPRVTINNNNIINNNNTNNTNTAKDTSSLRFDLINKNFNLSVLLVDDYGVENQSCILVD